MDKGRIARGVLSGLLVFSAVRAAGDTRQKSSARPLRAGALASISIDYPGDGSIFPPEITAPTFLWRDGSKAAVWRIEVAFADGSPAIHAAPRGERMRIGKIDPECVSEFNELPKLTPLQAAMRTWIPDAAAWERIKAHSRAGATVTITGYSGTDLKQSISRGQTTLSTSDDPAAAPVFYRDVPLMPAETEKGVIKPLAAAALPLVAWRLRNLAEPRSRVVMEDLPVCANCHSFSADGKTLGMDLDGLQNNKGRYTLTPVKPETSIGNENVIQWSSSKGRLKGSIRVGFMSQVSPDGQHVVTTINPADTPPGAAEPPSNYYVANFKDYKFLQVFYPTRGILASYNRSGGVLQPLPGADDPRFVQMGAVWSPDGKYLVFARAQARDPNPEGVPLAKFSNDPNERQIQYDLYRIPFNNGDGGTPEPIAGASRNGMSNTFPKVSPDGRWIVFVKCRNGQLMRPDSQLYIVPAAGGEARRMRCNTARMNSWHSFSPNGRWLVFSSKSRSPYTQMYLTHIDAEGKDSPPILVENTTAANRAVNLPEFVNIAPDSLRSIGGPAIEYYRLVDSALYAQKHARFEESVALWRKAVAINAGDATAQANMAVALLQSGRANEAAEHFRKSEEIKLGKAVEDSPASAPLRNDFGALLLNGGRVQEAVAQFRKAAEIDPRSAAAHCNMGRAFAAEGNLRDAEGELRKAMELDPRNAPAYYNLGVVFEKRGDSTRAIDFWKKALELDGKYAEAHASLASALYARGDAAQALRHWLSVIDLRPNDALALRQAAWLLATSPDAGVRNGSDALTFAVREVQLGDGKDAAALDALAAAYAEKERFADAMLTAKRALSLANQTGEQALAKAIEGRIALYEADRPFREIR